MRTKIFFLISAAVVLVAAIVIALSFDFVDESNLPIEEGGGPYVPAGEEPVMQEPAE